MRIKPILLCAILLLILPVSVLTARAEYSSFITAYQFGVNSDGFSPSLHLVQGANGTFYGGTAHGGASGRGVIYSLAPDGTFTVLHNFNGVDIAGVNNDGTGLSSLILGSDGNLYGTASGGGSDHAGTVFSITPAGVFTTLHSFVSPATGGINLDGAEPTDLIQGSDGDFYGTAATGGFNGAGTVFRITPAGSLATLHSFAVDPTQGSHPNHLIQGRDGNFYGTTSLNYPDAIKGTIFSLTPGGVFTTLYTFGSHSLDGEGPQGLVQGNDGNFYGTTLAGGSNGLFPVGNGNGTAFSITPAGTLTTLLSFGGDGEAGISPSSLILGSDGNFYGVTQSDDSNFYGNLMLHGGPYNPNGTLFRMTPAGTISIVHVFAGGATDATGGPAPLLLGTDGSFYGVSPGAGVNDTGTVYVVAPNGGHILLHSFAPTDGLFPGTDLTRGKDGKFYGTTGPGSTTNTLFSVDATGRLATLYRFPADGSKGFYLDPGLTQGTDGNFYGTAQFGGANDSGTIFQFTPGGVLTVLHDFGAQEGGEHSKLVQGTDGSFYGTVVFGGSSQMGAIFSISPAGKFNLLHNFSGNEGRYPHGFIQGRKGKFYGTTVFGGANDTGSIFVLTPAGTLTTLHSFGATRSNANDDGANPRSSLTLGADGNFYGTTASGGRQAAGTFFSITPAGAFTSLHSFGTVDAATGFSADGTDPEARLIQANNGSFYGTTSRGGYYDHGTIFSVTSAGVLNTLFNFSTDHGVTPLGGLVPNGIGGLYVVVPSGGANGYGQIGNFSTPLDPPMTAPVIAGLLATNAQINAPFAYQITASSIPTGYDARGLPPGLNVDGATGLISGTPLLVGTYTVNLSATNAFGTGTSTLTLTISSVPTVSFVVPGADGGNKTAIVEGGPKLKLLLTREGGDLSQLLSVPYKVVGNSTAGVDYKPLSGVATIPAGATSVPLKVHAYDDGVADGTKVVKIKLLPSSDGSYTFGTNPKVKVTIVDLEGVQ